MKLGLFFTLDQADAGPVVRGKGGRPIRKVSASPALEPPPPPPTDATLTLDLRVEKPDIVLVENMEDVDTDAIVFHVSFKESAKSV